MYATRSFLLLIIIYYHPLHTNTTLCIHSEKRPSLSFSVSSVVGQPLGRAWSAKPLIEQRSEQSRTTSILFPAQHNVIHSSINCFPAPFSSAIHTTSQWIARPFKKNPIRRRPPSKRASPFNSSCEQPRIFFPSPSSGVTRGTCSSARHRIADRRRQFRLPRSTAPHYPLHDPHTLASVSKHHPPLPQFLSSQSIECRDGIGEVFLMPTASFGDALQNFNVFPALKSFTGPPSAFVAHSHRHALDHVVLSTRSKSVWDPDGVGRPHSTTAQLAKLILEEDASPRLGVILIADADLSRAMRERLEAGWRLWSLEERASPRLTGSHR